MEQTQHRPAPALLVAVTAGVLGGALLDTLAAAAFGWRPVGTIERLGVFALATACAVFALCVVLRPLRGAIVNHARELLLFALVCIACWLAAEAAAHHLERGLRPPRLFHTRGANLHQVFTPVPEYLPGIEGVSVYTTGPFGVRASGPPAPRHTRRILCVGGSTTECTYLDDAETWPALLMHCLNDGRDGAWWVGSIGVSGFDTRDHLRFLEESALPGQLGIDAVVLQVGINDLWRYLAGEEERIAYNRFQEAGPSREATARPPQATRTPLWTHSRLIQLYHTLRQRPPAPETVEGEGGLEYRIRRQKRQEAGTATQLPDLARGLGEYGARLRRIIETCRARGIRPVFTTQPVLWAEELSTEAAERCWFGWLEDGRYLTLPLLRRAMEAYNDTLRAVCDELQAPLADLAFMHGNPDYFYDDCHFTEAGARVAAGRICAAVPAK